MSKKLLKDCAYYVTDRISSSNLTSENYIGVDNMLPNKAGVTLSESVPTSGDVTAFNVGDILIGNIRPYFKKIWLANFDGGCSPDVLCIRCNRDVPPEYLYGVLSQDSFFDYDMAGSKGSKMPRGDKNHIMNYPIPILNDMSKIGDFIIDINAKISNNNRINAELESMAKTIYDYWFTQFDFPDENGKPYKSSGGKMVWNEELKREIPEGWVSGNIGDLFESQAGYAFKSEEWRTFGHPVLTIKCINENGTININDSSFIDDYNPKMKKYSVENGNMIFAMSGNTIGKLGIISSSIANILINQRVLILRTNAKTIAFPYFILKNDKIQNSIRQLGANSAQPNISEDAVRSIKICLPPEKMLNSYNNYCETLFEKIILNQIENQQLASLRDWLLPMLMNGQVGFEGVE